VKIVILAAGIGSRLGFEIPKALVNLDRNTTILDFQIKSLKGYFNLSDIIIVVGYKKNLIFRKYPGFKYAINTKYKYTNTSKSLLAGVNLDNNDEDIIYINGDVVFEPKIIELMCENTKYNLICVNNEKVGEEEVKYNLDENGNIKCLSKYVEDPLGEAVGINYIKKDYLTIFKNCLNQCNDHDYHEKAVELAIERGIKFSPLNIGKRFCIEIDFEKDLELVKKRLKSGE